LTFGRLHRRQLLFLMQHSSKLRVTFKAGRQNIRTQMALTKMPTCRQLRRKEVSNVYDFGYSFTDVLNFHNTRVIDTGLLVRLVKPCNISSITRPCCIIKSMAVIDPHFNCNSIHEYGLIINLSENKCSKKLNKSLNEIT